MLSLLTYDQATRIKGQLKFASTDAARPVLCGINLEWDTKAGELALISTNSYVLGHRRFRTELQADKPTGSVLVPAKELWNAIDSTIKQAKASGLAVKFKTFRLVIAYDENDADGVTVTTSLNPESVIHVRRVEGDFPKWRSLMPDDLEAGFQGDAFPAFNPAYFKDLIDGIGITKAQMNKPIKLWGTTELKPFGFTYSETDVGHFLQTLIMPVRV